MARVFTCLAVSNLIVFFGVAALGLLKPDETPDRHVLLAVFALMVSALVQVITFTYFTVTGKMMAQAMHLGHMGLDRMAEVKSLKRSMTYCLGGIFASVVLGTASGAVHWRDGLPARMHLVAAMVVLACHVFLLTREYILVVNNGKVFDEVMGEYAAKKESQTSSPKT